MAFLLVLKLLSTVLKLDVAQGGLQASVAVGAVKVATGLQACKFIFVGQFIVGPAANLVTVKLQELVPPPPVAL
jgi:hypothetical protein